jgi:hypothetical protein
MATTITIKNSSVAGKVPDVDSIQVAELALNLADKKLYSKNASDEVFEVNSVVNSGDTLPGSGTNPGDLFWDTNDETLYYWDGTQWQAIASGSAVDGEYLKLTGGNLTGDLTLGTDKITLDASNGSAVFESSVNGSAFYSLEPTGTSALAKLSWFHFYLADSAGDKTVEIKNDGSITAAGDVKVGNINTTGNAPTDKGINLFNSGQISCQLDGTVPSGTQLGIQQWYGSTKTFEVFNDGSASFAGLGVFGSYTNGLDNATDTSFRVNSEYLKGEAFNLRANGNAKFSGDVTVSSRNKMWMLVEQGGLCHMVEQSRSIDPGFGVKKEEYPKLRDVFKELDLVEQALNDVMERLRMNPPAGWPVWDGSNETE